MTNPMVKKFRMLKDSELEPKAKAGTTVFAYGGYDYGLARDDTIGRGIPHVSVTLNPCGGVPFFTVPERDLEPTP